MRLDSVRSVDLAWAAQALVDMLRRRWRSICLLRCAARSFTDANDAGWSSSVARWAHNPEVAGSNPVPATTAHRLGSLRGTEPYVISGWRSDASAPILRR